MDHLDIGSRNQDSGFLGHLLAIVQEPFGFLNTEMPCVGTIRPFSRPAVEPPPICQDEYDFSTAS